MKILVLGVGNPGRRDDGLGYALIDKINRGQVPISPEIGTCPPFLIAEWKYQLNIEDAHAIKEADLVLFVDAAKEGDSPAVLTEVRPAVEISFSTHALKPAAVLALSEELYGRAPKAFLLAVRGYDFDLGEGLSPRAAANLEAAVSLFSDLLASFSGRPPETAGT